MTVNFQIRSLDREKWWKPDGAGYTSDRSQAGVFSATEIQALRLDDPDFDANDPSGDVLIVVNE